MIFVFLSFFLIFLDTKGATTSGTSKADSKNSQGSSSQQKKTDGRQEQPVDIMNFDDIEVQEEVENWLMRVCFTSTIEK